MIGTSIHLLGRTYGKAELLSSKGDLDRALAGAAFAVNELACVEAALVLKNFKSVETDVIGPSTSNNFLYHLCVAAICHQINWDYLSNRLAVIFEASHITAEYLSKVSAREVAGWLEDYNKPERIRAAERASLLRDLGQILVRDYAGDATKILIDSNRKLVGPDGFLLRLDAFASFKEDPLRKKSNVLIHEIVRAGIARFEDEGNIQPAIDYHIIRLYLRTGRVVPLHQATLDLLKEDSSPRPRLVKLIRKSVGEALSLTALYANLSIPYVNGLEWQIGRGICERGTPKCTGPISEALFPFLNEHGVCPNVKFCFAFSDPDWQRLREPDLKKSFY